MPMVPILAWCALLPPALAQEVDPPAEEPGEVFVVTGSRVEEALSDAVVATEVVTREQIAASGAEDASEVLELLPGVQVERSFRGAGVSMQGLDPEYVLVLVDGQRMIGRRDGVIDLSRIPAERIERIEVVKGAASALYGSDAIAGVVHIITRQPSEPWSADLHGSYGSRNTVAGSAVLGWKRERVSVGSSVGYHGTDGYDWDEGDEQTDGNRVRQGNADLDLGLRPSPAWTLNAEGSYQIRDSRGVDESGLATFDRRNLTEDAGARLGAELRPDGPLKLGTHLAGSMLRDQYVLDQRDSDELDSYEETREALAQVDGQLDALLGRHQLLSVGVEGSAEGMESPRLSQPGQRFRLAAFAQDEIALGRDEQLSIVPSGRVDLDSWFGVHPTPRLAARWDPRDWLALRAAVGQGFRAPVFKEMFLYFENPSAGYQVEGNPDLRPETSFNASVGTLLRPAEAIELRLDGFHARLHDMITIGFLEDATAESYQRWGYTNVAEAWTAGFEVAFSAKFQEIGAAQLGYGYTFTRDEESERPLDGRAPHRGTASLQAGHPRWGLDGSLRAELVGSALWFLDEDGDGVEDEIRTDPYLNLGLRVQQRILGGRLALFAGVDNLLGAGDALYVHLDPRTFYGGLDLHHPRPQGDAP